MSGVARLAPGTTVAAARRQLAQIFRAAAIDAPDLDARVLLGHGLGLEHAGLIAASDRTLTDAERTVVARLARRRLAREPVARIVGTKEFWGLTLQLDAATLVPRPETETVVEAALAAIEAAGARAAVRRIADLGTGSGALLLALLTELPQAVGVGTDMSVAALAMARANAYALGLNHRAAFVQSDFGAALARGFDLVVANPPYVRSDEIAALSADVRDHDPRAALDGGGDGLRAYRAIIEQAPRLLASHGVLVLELGHGQAQAVIEILARRGLAPCGLRDDLSGTPRALVAAPARPAGRLKGHSGPAKKALGISCGSD